MANGDTRAYRHRFLRAIYVAIILTLYFEFCTARHADAQTNTKKTPARDTVKVCAQFLQLGYPHEETLTTVPFMVLKDGVDTTTLTIPRNVKAEHVIIMKDWYNFLLVDGKVVSIAPVSRRKRCPYKASA